MSGIWRGGLPRLPLLLVGCGQMCWSRVDVKASMTNAREGDQPFPCGMRRSSTRYGIETVVLSPFELMLKVPDAVLLV